MGWRSEGPWPILGRYTAEGKAGPERVSLTPLLATCRGCCTRPGKASLCLRRQVPTRQPRGDLDLTHSDSGFPLPLPTSEAPAPVRGTQRPRGKLPPTGGRLRYQWEGPPSWLGALASPLALPAHPSPPLKMGAQPEQSGGQTRSAKRGTCKAANAKLKSRNDKESRAGLREKEGGSPPGLTSASGEGGREQPATPGGLSC